MSPRWRVILPVVGLLLFVGETYQSVRVNRATSHNASKYFWWSSIRLDSDPLNKHPQGIAPCKAGEENCVIWDLRGIWVDPGLLTMLLMLSGLPASVICAILVCALGHLGISEIWSFMISMPLLFLSWFYFLGRLIDRRKFKRLHSS